MRLTTLCYIEKDGCYLMLHRTKKENDYNKDKWIGIGGKFENGEFSYDLTIKTAVGEMTNHLTGKVDGDVITGKSANPMGEFDVTGRRI